MAHGSAPSKLDGNRIWRIPDPRGALVQKLYAERKGLVLRFLGSLGRGFFPIYSSATATGRWRTERDLLAAWRGAGLDVPRDLTAERPEFAGPRVTILEHVHGVPLGKLLLNLDLPRGERDGLLRRFAATWGARHDLALRTNRRELVHAHPTLFHVMVDRDRLVTFDLERRHTMRHILPLLAREIGKYLQSLRKRVPEDVFRRDLVAIIEGYPRRDILENAIREVRRSRNYPRRSLWAVDRLLRCRRKRKKNWLVAIDLMAEALRRHE